MSNENLTNYEIQCADCGQSFTFTAEEQEFYQSRGFSEPKRCSQCRQARKNRNNGGNRRNYSSSY